MLIVEGKEKIRTMYNTCNNLHMHATMNIIVQRLHECSHVHTRACAHTHIVCAYMGAKTHANIQKLTYMPNNLKFTRMRTQMPN